MILIQDLPDSLLTEEEREIEREWIEEAERRYAEYEAGRAESVSMDDVVAKLRAKYGSER